VLNTFCSQTNALYKAPNTGKNAGFTDLGVLSGQSPVHNYSVAYGINNSGQVVGISKSASTGSERAFIGQRGGLGMKKLTDLEEESSSRFPSSRGRASIAACNLQF